MSEELNNKSVSNQIWEEVLRMQLNATRDGTQSKDGNRLRADDGAVILKCYNRIQNAAKEAGFEQIISAETWGGASVSEPIRISGENSLENFQNYKEAAPDIRHQALYRGAQGFGFLPLESEAQEWAIEQMVDKGIEHWRIFDMMNDITNLEPSFNKLKEFGDKVIIDGAISYISEPEGKERVWEPEDYVEYGQKLIELGANQITLKDYAGLLNVEDTTAIVKGLRDAGIEKAIVVHSHGEQSEVLNAAIDAGANFIDAGLGDLSGGGAHIDMLEMLEFRMEKLGIDINSDEYKQHAAVKILEETREVINTSAVAYQNLRTPADQMPEESVRTNSRIAGGGFVAMADMLKEVATKNVSHKELLTNALEKMAVNWEASGRPNTVTPGSLIASKNANIAAMQELILSKELTVGTHTQEYKDVLMGRYGHNKGLEDKNIGDTELRDLFLLESGINSLQGANIDHQSKLNIILELDLDLKATMSLPRDEAVEAAQGKLEQFTSIVKDRLETTEPEASQEILRCASVGKFPIPSGSLAKAEQAADSLIEDGIVHKAYNIAKGEEVPQAVKDEVKLNFLLVRPEQVEAMYKAKAGEAIASPHEPDPRLHHILENNQPLTELVKSMTRIQATILEQETEKEDQQKEHWFERKEPNSVNLRDFNKNALDRASDKFQKAVDKSYPTTGNNSFCKELTINQPAKLTELAVEAAKTAANIQSTQRNVAAR